MSKNFLIEEVIQTFNSLSHDDQKVVLRELMETCPELVKEIMKE